MQVIMIKYLDVINYANIIIYVKYINWSSVLNNYNQFIQWYATVHVKRLNIWLILEAYIVAVCIVPRALVPRMLSQLNTLCVKFGYIPRALD